MAVVPTVLATPHVLGDALSTIFYVSNWYSIHRGVTYFSLSTQPSPLLHTWSLAIEEQFYLVWPLVVLGVLTLGTSEPRPAPRRAARRAAPRPSGRAVDVLGGGQLLAGRTAPGHGRPGLDPPAAAAHPLRRGLPRFARLGPPHGGSWRPTATPPVPTTAPTPGPRRCSSGRPSPSGSTLWREGSGRRWFTRMASVLALAGVAGTAALWATTSETSTFAFSGGFLLASLAAGRRRARLRGGAALARGPPPGAAAPPAVGSHLLRRLPLVLAGAPGDDRATAALGRLPALPGPGRRHRGDRRPQLRPGRDAGPPRRAEALAILGGGAHRRGGRHQCGLHQHADAGRGGRIPGLAARGQRRVDARRPGRGRVDARRAPRPDPAATTTTTTTVPSYLSPAAPTPATDLDASRSRSSWSAIPSPARSAWVWRRRRSNTTCRSPTRGHPGAPCRCRRRSRSSSIR